MGGVFNNGGTISITNSTIRENVAEAPLPFSSGSGGGIKNGIEGFGEGPVRGVKNTIIAGNSSFGPGILG